MTTHPAPRATAPSLAELTTLRLGGPVGRYVEADDEAALVAAVRDADAAGEPVLVLGGGSNLVVDDAGFDGLVVRDLRAQVRVESADTCGGASISVTAGTPWGQVVDRAVDEGWVGVEALAGIPGSTGATPVQNVGAYGQEVAGVLSTVRVLDRQEGRVRTLALTDLGLGYRTSVLKRSLRGPGGAPTPWYPSPRFVVLEVGMQLRLGSLSTPVAYAELARRLDVPVGGRAPLAEVRDAVLELRAGKGMVLDAEDPDTWSAGSFFTNPVLASELAATLPEGAPRYPVRAPRPERSTGPSLGAVDPELVKTSAAWLIEHAGFGRGHGLPGVVGLSTKHTLALTHRGGGRTQDLLALAREIRDGVRQVFGVTLEPEPVLVGCSL
ncbi:UDP-N-acetylmuramate dehydrogenase [Cellulomonas bogoriensis]|uniref:UDP-N-acetylenolpyruvoylglucosamine reductase n=1 Tax=Cellulomonas bogoriensis 69B4 = DSM 16987 TaxID=1386082 RepID=A0A0A0C326_9CELL|nr:UDP-N-acetylmuramate dehydrogenase [Cellulomonas bogoriensis]KGM14581.1 UDP-N-acetylenolpyruvoylglucosamine reductase [Cellulomonas bogoriensis 69B4 = DSM 16987]